MSHRPTAAATGPPGALARPDWRAGGPLTAAELNLEQNYLQQRVRRHLRLVHGWGVVCGLTVVSAGDGWRLLICPGYGIGPCGDEIVVATPLRFDLRDYLWMEPMDVKRSDRVWIALEPSDEAAEPLKSPGCGCGCSGHDAESSAGHGNEGVQVVVSWAPLLLPRGRFDVCKGGTPPCPPCPETCGLTLASVQLPESRGARLLAAAIENA